MAWGVSANPENYTPGDPATGDQVQSPFGMAGVDPENYEPGEWAEAGLPGSFGVTTEELSPETLDDIHVWWDAPDFDPPELQNLDPFNGETEVDVDSTVTLEVVDVSGVDVSSVIIRVDGVIVWSSDAQQNGFTVVKSTVTGPPSGFRYVITPPADFDYNDTIPVRVQADDLAPVPNSLDTTYNFDTKTDLAAPVLSNQDPAPSATGQDKNKNIEFDLTDAISGVDLDTVRIYVEGNLAYRGDTDLFQSPYDGVDSDRTAISQGHSFVIHKAASWASSASISVRVVADDIAGNSLDTTYSFTVEDYVDPIIDTPAPVGPNAVETTNITFSTKDVGGSGIDSSTINVTVNGTAAITNGAFQTGFGGTITGNLFNGYDVDIDPAAKLDSGADYEIVVDVDDLDGNSATQLVWYFTVRDWQGPAIEPITPLNGATGVSVSTNITVEITDETALVANSITIEIDKDGGGFEYAYKQGETPAFKSGWNGTNSSVSPITGGYRIVVDPEENFQAATLIQVRVIALDANGNPTRLV